MLRVSLVFGLCSAACGDGTARRPSHDAASDVTGIARCNDAHCLVPAGTFLEGSPPTEAFRAMYSEEQHAVTLTHALEVSRFETTQEEWVGAGFRNQSGTVDNGDGERDCTEARCPIGVITWPDAVAFANKKSRAAGLPACIELLDCVGEEGAGLACGRIRQTTTSYYDCAGYRLPTSVEFQYLLRAGTTTTYYSGDATKPRDDCYFLDHLAATAWYCENSGKRTHPVGQLAPNPWGLFDMMGNAAEFTASAPYTSDRKSTEPLTDPHATLPDGGTYELRGGAMNAWPTLLRSANQGAPVPGLPGSAGKGAGCGFRLVRSIPSEEISSWK